MDAVEAQAMQRYAAGWFLQNVGAEYFIDAPECTYSKFLNSKWRPSQLPPSRGKVRMD